MKKNRFALLATGSFIGTLILLMYYTCTGYMNISMRDVFSIIVETIKDPKAAKETYGTLWYVVIEVRLPRILAAAIAGAALSIAGTGFQGVLLNPLADPYTLGISSGAALGAAMSIVFGWNFFGVITVQICAFLFALITLLIVLRMATLNGRVSPVSLVLAGVIISAFFSAALSFMKHLAGEEVGSIVFWLMGSFASKKWSEVIILLCFTILGFIISLFYSKDLNVLSLGDKNASSLGINTSRLRTTILITASLLSAITVSIAGIIGFIGLIIPHLVRMVTGPDNTKLMILSPLVGAALLATADNFSRAWLPAEVPIGTITALLGGPFFIFIFRKKLKGE
ncbi:MAG TPA: iron ABC transporter permease [Thermotogota bacterium]|nr:iron ABC transporter permease [Thermotogota bacterium]HPJ89743.1 iron ABC transporter permease [Thermotogota bacterium]HPR95993.1 iron ABC transporter permease [Thermotogota bacterium]